MELQWTREPREYSVADGRITITTEPHTDLWQRTYYHFRNDNAPVLQAETEEKFFSQAVFPGNGEFPVCQGRPGQKNKPHVDRGVLGGISGSAGKISDERPKRIYGRAIRPRA